MRFPVARFLSFSLLACGVFALAADPAVIAPNADKLLLLDTRVVAHSVNARLTLGKPAKDSRNPLMKADQPWENALNNLYPNVCWDPEFRRWRMWYKCVLADADVIARMDHPSTVHDVGWYLLHATSSDGVQWEKPALGLHAFAGNAQTNIVARDTPNVGVFRDEHDPDASRRYKMTYDVGLGKPRVRFSPDGIHWSEPIEVEGFTAQHGDTHNNAFWDERSGKYLWFTKLYLGERLAARFESDDFMHWRGGEMVLRSSVEEGRAHQVYALTVFPYASIYLGYAMIYHVGAGRAVDCELAWSPDSIQWQRVAPGKPFLPRGETGAFDTQCIYAQAGPPTQQDGRLMLYYGGSDVPHTGWKRHCLPALARMRIDGFAALEPIDAAQDAQITTAPLNFSANEIKVSADAGGGELRVMLLGEGDKVLATSEPIRADMTDAPVRWTGSPPPWPKVGRLRFELRLARLFAFAGARLANEKLPALPEPPPHEPALNPPTVAVHFDKDAEHWTGVDRIEHHADGGVRGGYVRFTRAGTLRPIAFAPASSAESPLAGDWSERFGSGEIVVEFQTRAGGGGGKAQFEIWARDVSGWRYAGLPGFGESWTPARATLRAGWTDAEARAAGWLPSLNAFSWRETLRNVGKLAVLPMADGPQSFDLDELTVSANASR